MYHNQCKFFPFRRSSRSLSWESMIRRLQLHLTKIFPTFLHWRIPVQKMHLKGTLSMTVSKCEVWVCLEKWFHM